MNLDALRIIAVSWPLTTAWTVLLLACVAFYIVRSIRIAKEDSYTVIDERSKMVERALDQLVASNKKQSELLQLEHERKNK